LANANYDDRLQTDLEKTGKTWF